MDQNSQAVSKVTVPVILERKLRGEKISCLTAYDYSTARLVDEAGIEMILVGDSLAQAVLGYDSTVPVTVDEMLHHLRAVRRGVRRALLIVDLPYGAYHVSDEQALANAIRFLKEGGAEAVKLEGGRKRARLVRKLVEAQIPVMGHIGLTPQSIHAMGGYRVQGRTLDSAADFWPMPKLWRKPELLPSSWKESRANSPPLSPAACEFPPSESARAPTAMARCWCFTIWLDSVIMPPAKFVRSYANLRETLHQALISFRADVAEGRYPGDHESYHWTAAMREQFEKETARSA